MNTCDHGIDSSTSSTESSDSWSSRFHEWIASIDQKPKTKLESDDILYRLGLELMDWILTDSLYRNFGADSNDLSSTGDIKQTLLEIVGEYIALEYFEDGFVCLEAEASSQRLVT